MHFRRFLLSIAVVVVVGVSAAPAAQHPDHTAGVDGTGSSNSTGHDTDSSLTPTGTPLATSTPSVLSTTPVVQTTSTPIQDSTPVQTPTPTQQSTSTPPTVVETVLTTAQVATSTSTQQADTSSTPVPTVFPTINSATPTYSTPSATPTSANSSADNSSSTTSKGGVSTKTILIVGGTVGGIVICAFIAFSIFRKLKLKPSEHFEQRLEPTGSTGGHLEEWNDPRVFRGYMQNESSTLGRSNSQASSKYSYDAADEKAGGLGRQHTGQWGRADEKQVFENGDGLREDGRGYRGF